MVASANRGVRGTFSDVSDDMLDDVRSLVKGVGRFFSLNAEVRGKPPAYLHLLGMILTGHFTV